MKGHTQLQIQGLLMFADAYRRPFFFDSQTLNFFQLFGRADLEASTFHSSSSKVGT
jgi:hypothetical protein